MCICKKVKVNTPLVIRAVELINIKHTVILMSFMNCRLQTSISL